MSYKSPARFFGIAAGCAAVLTSVGVLMPLSANAAQITTTNSFGCTVVTTPETAATSHTITVQQPQ